MLTANSPNALDLLLPKAKGKSTNTQNVSVSIDKDLQYFVNNQKINGEYIEIELKKALEGQEKPIFYAYNRVVKCATAGLILHWSYLYGPAY